MFGGVLVFWGGHSVVFLFVCLLVCLFFNLSSKAGSSCTLFFNLYTIVHCSRPSETVTVTVTNVNS